MVDATKSHPIVGQLLDGRYEIVREIAVGGMSTVYEAKHVRIGRPVAIKVLHRDMAGDAEVVARFLNEARAVGTFGHPNIVASTDFGELPGHVPYLVLEYLEGHTLSQEISNEGPLPVPRVTRIAVQIASALDAAHSRNVIHRDLTSANIFLVRRAGKADQVKVLDFGISKFLEATEGSPKTRRGLTMGTPEFMAPEQISDPDAVDARVDVYALGVILYHMLDGRHPFTRTPLQALLTQIVVEPPPPISRPGIPGGLQAIVDRALTKNPVDRFSSMREMGAELERFAARINAGGPWEGGAEEVRWRGPVLVPRSTDPSGGVVTPPSVVTPGSGLSPASGPLSSPLPGTIPTAVSAEVTGRIRVPNQEPATVPPVGGRRKLSFAAWVLAACALAAVAVLLLRPPTTLPPTSAPVVHVSAPAPPVAAAPPVRLSVASPTADARVTLRGRTHRLPLDEELTAGSQPEIVELTAPGREGRRFWVTFDRPITLAAELPLGKGVVEASAEETVVALGGQPLAGDSPRSTASDPASAQIDRPHRTAAGPHHSRSEVGGKLALVRANRPGTAERGSPSELSGESAPAAGVPTEALSGTAAVNPAVATVEGRATAPGAGGAGEAAKARAPAAAPVAAPVVAPLPRGLDPAKTQTMVRARLPEVQRCYERAKMDDPDLRGRVTLKISVAATGAVTAVAVESSSLHSSAVESCMMAIVQAWKFPAPAGGPAVISYPFSFH